MFAAIFLSSFICLYNLYILLFFYLPLSFSLNKFIVKKIIKIKLKVPKIEIKHKMILVVISVVPSYINSNKRREDKVIQELFKKEPTIPKVYVPEYSKSQTK
jgi:hypothetical protein